MHPMRETVDGFVECSFVALGIFALSVGGSI